MDYDQTCAPVLTWPAIRLLLSLVLINKWHMQQIDYVQAYSQAPVDCQMYMEIPSGFQMNSPNSENYLLEVLQNIYGQRQAGRVWNLYLSLLNMIHVYFTRATQYISYLIESRIQ